MSESPTIWQRLRVLLVQLLVGLALGVAVWEMAGRRLLALKYGSFGSSVTCAPDVERALAEFDAGLRIAALIGAVGFVILTFLVRLWWRRRKKSGSQPSQTPPA